VPSGQGELAAAKEALAKVQTEAEAQKKSAQAEVQALKAEQEASQAAVSKAQTELKELEMAVQKQQLEEAGQAQRMHQELVHAREMAKVRHGHVRVVRGNFLNTKSTVA
jgi:predicted  nucleic acid-binding Zn-ribbon protein